jgi:aminoglycoside 3-N-acetyltransferase I
MTVRRLTTADCALARELFLTMAGVFEVPAVPLSDGYLGRLLASPDFRAFAAVDGDRVVGGLRAHVLPMTTSERSELFLYDIAVVPAQQRRGVGRALVAALRETAAAEGIDVVWVPADNEDTHALDFYRALGGEPAPVTIFTFGGSAD